MARHALGRERLHQHAPLALPEQPFGDQHRLAQAVREHLGPAFPADQCVGIVHHDLAQQFGVEHIDDTLCEDLLAHQIAKALLRGDRAEVVASQCSQRWKSPPSSGRAGQVIPDRLHGVHGVPAPALGLERMRHS